MQVCLVSLVNIVIICSTVRLRKKILVWQQRMDSGFIAFSPLAQGLLTDKYLNGIPENSRAARPTGFLQSSQVTPEKVEIIRQLNEVAHRRGQTLAEMALAWTLKDKRITSVIVGASSVKQLDDNLHALDNLEFTFDELAEIDQILLKLVKHRKEK